MDILLIMCIGILIGNRIFPMRWKMINERLQLLSTLLLIFSMGVSLGQRDHFLQELSQLGLQSFLFCLFPALGSVLLVFLISRRWPGERNHKPKK